MKILKGHKILLKKNIEMLLADNNNIPCKKEFPI